MESTLDRLGFAAGERVAVIHADDIGMCDAQSEGGFQALEQGSATSGSLMVPCPGFAAAAERAQGSAAFDLGVHLTLTAEWPEFRWGPVLGADAVPSLVDADGFLPRTAAEVAARARPEEVEAEMRAQVERALEAGIDVTHVDAHMGVAFLPPFVASYGRLLREFRLPGFLVRPDPAALALLGAESADVYEDVIGGLARDGWPLLDAFDADSLGFAPGAGAEHNRGRLERLVAGVTYLICHPACGGSELDAIVDDAHARDFERTFYGGDPGRRLLDELGIRTVGMRALRELVHDAV